MLFLMLPMVIGFIVSVTDGMKRMVAESDFEREVRTLNAEQEAALNEVDSKYLEQLAPLQEKLNDAREAVSSIEAAIQKVHGKPSAESSSEAA
jgi:phage host-nuclease inhibitor protein Gam